MFDDGASLYWPIHNRVDQGLALWSALGRRESKDMAEVGRLWLAAAEAGHTHAQHNVGCLFAQGNGVQQSDSTALKWFEKAVEQGEMHAMYDLARMYILGRGVEQSDEKAARWCEFVSLNLIVFPTVSLLALSLPHLHTLLIIFSCGPNHRPRSSTARPCQRTI